MIGLIVTALLQTFCALDQEDDSGYAFHCGEAGGIAAATAAFGVWALELCDDISDAYEDSDLDFMRYILRETSERPGRNEEVSRAAAKRTTGVMPDGHGLAGWAGSLAWSGAGAGLGSVIMAPTGNPREMLASKPLIRSSSHTQPR